MRRKSSRYNSRLGKLFFIIPAAIIISIVVYGYVELNSPGTLVVQAFEPNDNQLNVPVNVGSHSGTTPLTLSLGQGSYAVNYSALQWFHTPSPKDVVITPGLTVYADGIYPPIVRVIQVTQNGFNETAVTALHGVTPVVWLDTSSLSVTIEGGPFTHTLVDAGKNVTYTFPSIGVYQVFVASTGANMTVQVQ